MTDKNKTIDPLPDSFETEEQAGAFWDAHSTMDYQQHLERFRSSGCRGRVQETTARSHITSSVSTHRS